jgi:hypothetical protein
VNDKTKAFFLTQLNEEIHHFNLLEKSFTKKRICLCFAYEDPMKETHLMKHNLVDAFFLNVYSSVNKNLIKKQKPHQFQFSNFRQHYPKGNQSQ